MPDQTWDLRFPLTGADSPPFCRATISDELGDVVLVHAAPSQLDVTVADAAGELIASCSGLRRTAPGPMTVLQRRGTDIQLQDRWPDDDDLLRVVLLPGGEAGVLTAWWHAEDRSAWRWSLEFSDCQ
jgi:hypothetical protein